MVWRHRYAVCTSFTVLFNSGHPVAGCQGWWTPSRLFSSLWDLLDPRLLPSGDPEACLCDTDTSRLPVLPSKPHLSCQPHGCLLGTMTSQPLSLLSGLNSFQHTPHKGLSIQIHRLVDANYPFPSRIIRALLDACLGLSLYKGKGVLNYLTKLLKAPDCSHQAEDMRKRLHLLLVYLIS